jgi:hypothetical protein
MRIETVEGVGGDAYMQLSSPSLMPGLLAINAVKSIGLVSGAAAQLSRRPSNSVTAQGL